jgi:t-SNARE complex subunit (syntaxin)
VLDRIDCNIEKVSESVKGGLGQLQKASKYQKANRKMYVISCLAIVFIVLLLLLVVTKF